MRLQSCALAVTMSWDDGFPGARASRPHQAWHSLGHLPHLDQPATAPWLPFGLAAGVPADRAAACNIALKLSGGQRDRMRAGRPRSQAKADAVGGSGSGPAPASGAKCWRRRVLDLGNRRAHDYNLKPQMSLGGALPGIGHRRPAASPPTAPGLILPTLQPAFLTGGRDDGAGNFPSARARERRA